MESIVIHWTRQIKEVVNNHDSSTSAETAGPLDEIEFWKGRAQDFVGIQGQLEGQAVCRIIDVLHYAKSNYIGPFQTLTKQIAERAAEANDNLKYLETIREQCTDLRTISADKIVTILPDLLNRIRLIWSYSSFYNDNERVCGILRKISNEIIRRFRGHVQVSEIMDGDVEVCISRLQEAINCGVDWKSMYNRTVEAIKRNKGRYGRGWEIEGASIFAQIDAFVQRCRDLVEVCENQIQFVRKSSANGSNPGPVPQFGGTKAQEIVDGIEGIQFSFEQHVDRLRKLDYDVLDVRVSRWHDDYHFFKNAVKDLEVMFTNVINAAFENSATVVEGVALVETFSKLAKRDAVKRCVEKKVVDTKNLLLSLVHSFRNQFDQNRTNPPLRIQEPQFAGSALWAHSLSAIVTESYNSIIRLKNILTARDMEELNEEYSSFIVVARDFKLLRYKQWSETLGTSADNPNGLQSRLDKHLLRRADSDGSATTTTVRSGTEIVCDFDEDIVSLFSEVSYWEKFHGEFSIPYVAHDLCNKKEQLRVMREHVMMVVRAYNDIIRDISSDERHLFIDHLRRLDRRIGPGMTKLTWQSRNMIDMYVKDCCSNCQEVHAIVKEFKETKSVIMKICKQMSTALLLRVDKNQVYEGTTRGSSVSLPCSAILVLPTSCFDIIFDVFSLYLSSRRCV
jgi:dynein heavy chain